MMRFHRRQVDTDQQAKTPTLLASAVLVKQSQVRAVPEQREWQVRAWEYFDAVGELRFASQWVSNSLSRCGLQIRAFEDGKPTPVDLADATGTDERARIPLDELFGGPTGHAEMLSRLATHLMVAGESYLIGFDTDEGDDGESSRRWLVSSSDEVSKGGRDSFKVRLPESDKQVPIDLARATVLRIWRPHPRRAWEADSPVRAALPVLKELVDLSAHISATVESRLAGAGLLLLPESATMPTPLTQQGEPLHEDPAMSTLIDAMVTPISDRDSAAAVVPIIVRIPDAATGKPEYMTFSTKLDERILDLRNSSIRRFSTIVDIPAEVMTGIAEANRWNAWKISEDAVKLHLEPLLALICDCLTTQYLWPALRGLGVSNPERYVVSYDLSNLIQKPNRGQESQNLHQEGLLRERTVLEANGFSETDAPDDDERRRTLLTRLALKGVDPVMVAPYLKELGIELELPEVPEPRPEPDQLGEGVLDRGRPPQPRQLPGRQETTPDNEDAEERRAVVASLLPPDLDFAAVEFGAVRALELVGKRLLNNSNRQWKGQLRRVQPWAIHTYIPATEIDELLDGAYTLVHQCLPGQTAIHATIDRYVRERLTQRLAHDRDRLMSMLVTAGCFAGGGSRAIA